MKKIENKYLGLLVKASLKNEQETMVCCWGTSAGVEETFFLFLTLDCLSFIAAYHNPE